MLYARLECKVGAFKEYNIYITNPVIVNLTNICEIECSYGRIGNPSSNSKKGNYANLELAVRAAKKIIDSKIKKGYTLSFVHQGRIDFSQSIDDTKNDTKNKTFVLPKFGGDTTVFKDVLW